MSAANVTSSHTKLAGTARDAITRSVIIVLEPLLMHSAVPTKKKLYDCITLMSVQSAIQKQTGQVGIVRDVISNFATSAFRPNIHLICVQIQIQLNEL
jgi:hypothetical protein